MAKRAPLGLVVSLCVLGACAYTDPGNGSQKLAVDVDLHYAPTQSDSTAVQAKVDSAAAQDSNDALLTPGTTAAGNDFRLILTDTDTHQQFTLGQEGADVAGYHRHLEIRVEAGADSLTCRLEAPARHTIGRPLQGQLWRKGDPLKVSWQTPDGLRADEVDIKLELANYAVTLNRDTGSFTVLAPILVEGNETLTVTRRNRVKPAGGAAPSQVRAQYAVTVNFQVER